MRLVSLLVSAAVLTYGVTAGALLNNPCIDKTTPQSKQPWCDPTLDVDARSADAVSRMTLAEKINALGTNTDAIKSLGLNHYDWYYIFHYFCSTPSATNPTLLGGLKQLMESATSNTTRCSPMPPTLGFPLLLGWLSTVHSGLLLAPRSAEKLGLT